ncbi:alpha-tocopherol transfer protein-like [Chironomus tepperi]|uniref:alpha-tocopherol transfer protein-like n=1 Tax=Chironomus tepperi TaxID=113505 RepID=UPI00391F3B2B
MPLDNFFIEKAKNELRETETRKAQSLEQFRDWINKHAFLKDVRQDDIHLLQFLRARKYNMNDAMQTFERFYVARKKYPQFFPDKKPNFERVMDFFKSGYCYPLPGRDAEGCRVVLVQINRLDTEKFTIFDGIRLTIFILALIMEEEETQIAGVKIIYDQQDITSKHLLMPKDAMEFVDMVKTITCARQKGSYMINLPSFAHFLLELTRGALTEKLKNRFFLYHTWDDFKASEHCVLDMLPKEHGGLKSEEEILKDFEEVVVTKWPLILETAEKAELDWSKVPAEKIKSNANEEVIGSFRKLEID